MFTEKGGAPIIDVNLNTISHYSAFPEECLRILEYLGSFGIQKTFAENGRPVANLMALKHLDIPGLDQFSLDNLRAGLTDGRIISSADKDNYNYWSTIVAHEMIRWQTGEISGVEMLDTLRRKTEFYYRSMERRQKPVELNHSEEMRMPLVSAVTPPVFLP